jgi:Flp pilus assembly protein TadD
MRWTLSDDLAAYRAAAVLYEAGDPVGAARELEPLMAADPTPKSVLELAGRAYFRSAQLRRAEEAFSRLVERDPSDAYARFALGRTLERQSRRAEAAACYRLAAAMDPKAEYVQALQRVTGQGRSKASPF